MNKLLIFGVNGFSGKSLLRYLETHHLFSQYEITGVDKDNMEGRNFEFIQADLSMKDSVEKILLEKQPDYIINFIGIFGSNEMDSLIQINTFITIRILECILKNKLNIQKILLIGSAAEYGIPTVNPLIESSDLNPVSPYGLSKVIQNQIIKYYWQNFKLPIVTARTFNIIGKDISRKLSIGSFLDQIQKAPDNGTISVGNLDPKRDFLDIDDVVDAYWKLLFSGRNGEIYNVARNESISMREILNFMIQYSKKRLQIVPNPNFMKKNDVPDIIGDNSKLSKECNWNPQISIEESIKRLFI